ncbi:hypothetical protein [Francisella hispaniensis]|uniref:Uncharacterized protein n=1 Tax=Francisella hispaniensis FSC454 TaxID=1088883 RepID=A0AAC9J9V3_9GAMM|nr:hypothetical protein [Francisella hispaniensis]APD50408.1 hypothetical protein FSC454_04335 [Francisella hispaniensis FSC454]
MKKITLLTLLLPCLFLNGYSVSLDKYLSYVEQRFDKSISPEAKIYEVIKRLNIKYLSEVSSIEDIDESQLVVEDFKTIPFSNALALAIASGDVKKTKKFSQVILYINFDVLASSPGYRKLAGLPHIAVNPIEQLKIFDNEAKLDSAYVKRMLEIIDLLAQRGANFNMSGKVNYNGHSYIYNNTPLVYAESVSSHYSSDLKKLQYELMARAILYGADPKLYGLEGLRLNEYSKEDLKNLKPLILKYYTELSINPEKFEKVKLAKSVMDHQDISKIIEAIDKKQSNSSVHKTAPKAVNKVSSLSDNESTPKAVTEVSSSLCCSIL